jgi:hypothetical protein
MTKQEEAAKILKIQICDGKDGCGKVIQDMYTCPQICDWLRHKHQKKYKNQIINAPSMRKITVMEVKP